MQDLVLVIKTHSDYSYLWPIIDDYIENIKLKKILFYDKSENLPKNFDQYIEYDQQKTYMQRLTHLTDIVKEDYILLIHDVDIIINLDENLLEKYFVFMKEKKVGYLKLHLSVSKDILKKGDLVLANLKNKCIANHVIPYDVTPAIWVKKTLNMISKKFPNLSYRDAENTLEFQNFFINNISCYSLDKKSNLKIIYCRNLCFSKEFNFLHITTKGKFTYPEEVYMDNKKEFLKIREKYKLKLESCDCTFVLKNARKL